MDYSHLAEYVSEIFNGSLEGNHPIPAFLIQGRSVNQFLRDYENSIFVNDKDTQKLLNNNITGNNT
jgi:hypothetical protein